MDLADVSIEMTKSLSRRAHDVTMVALTHTTAIDVRCPGAAHSVGGACVICDADHEGRVEVLLTHVERDALWCAERGRPFDVWLVPRLLKLGLLSRVDGLLAPTDAGRAVLELHCATFC
jgi:hypothetical protein